jgi:CheY-like chemotaxis protein
MRGYFQLAWASGGERVCRYDEATMACIFTTRNYPEESVAMESPTVLCIDDLPQALEVRKATLESHGFCVKVASTGHAALKTLEEASVAAVLLEYKLEGMDAEAVACHIKQRFPKVPIILLSAYSEMPERILWLVDEYVMKSELPERRCRSSSERTGSHDGQTNDGQTNRASVVGRQRKGLSLLLPSGRRSPPTKRWLALDLWTGLTRAGS